MTASDARVARTSASRSAFAPGGDFRPAEMLAFGSRRVCRPIYACKGGFHATVTREQLSPKNVLDVLSRHILVDGYHVVMDLKRSRGSYLYDARSDRPILDFFTSFATCPIGYNHPKMDDPEFRERSPSAALNKPANSDIYTEHFARVRRDVRRARRPEELTASTCSSSKAARSRSRTR